jgi:hypothetical protein
MDINNRGDPVNQAPDETIAAPGWLKRTEDRWDRIERWLAVRRRADLAAILFLIVATLLVALKISLRDAWLIRIDLLTAYLPFYASLGEQLRSFSIPGWSPFQASGLPFAGDPQSGWMYAPAMFWFTILPPVAAIKAMAATQILITALATYLFARLLGLRIIAALTGAIALAFGANVYHNTFCCTIWSQAIPWIPLGLLGVELAIRPGPLRQRAGGWAITGFAISQLFAGWIGQGTYNGLLIIGAYTLYRAVISPPSANLPFRSRVSRLLVSGAAMLLLGFGLAAAGALPRFDASRYSPISGTAYDVVEDVERDGGWQPEHMLGQLFNTYEQDRTTGRIKETFRRFYIGGFAASLALVAPLMARRRYATPYFVFVAATMLILTLNETALHRLFYRLPEFQTLHEHTPFRIIGLFYFFPSILAAIAVHSLRDWVRHRWLLPVAFVPPLVIFAIDRDIRTSDRYVGEPVIFAAIAVAVVLSLAMLIASTAPRLGARRSERLITLMAVLLLLGVVWDPLARTLNPRDLTAEATDVRLSAMIETVLSDTDPGGAGEFLQEQLRTSPMPFRYFGYDGAFLRTENGAEPMDTYHGSVRDPAIHSLLVSARAMRLGLYDVQGYNPAQYQPYVDYQRVMNAGVAQDYHDANVLRTGLGSPLLDLLSVRYIVVPAEVPPGRPDLLMLSQRYPTVFANGQVRVLENPAALPHAWLVRETQIATLDEMNALLLENAIDPQQTAFIEEAIPGIDDLPATDSNSISFDRYTPDAINLTVQSETGGLLVLAELYAPGWQAYVDGEPVETHRVNGISRGVVVPAGTSEVTFRYELRSLRIGLAISSITALIMIGIGIWNLAPWLRRRRIPHKAEGPFAN